ncbi:hypothetical protein BDY19DRAFT_905416 [Irpex rosettiformis]|uniref:Uncharacterized protein n=1 Tax=Irpex rosettiformis TaxID=378272 RepID=A0ACB8U855_9APHY|nr:hypothetical protein BDY19DRAFT_905416 [Irpex rosettiformis]
MHEKHLTAGHVLRGAQQSRGDGNMEMMGTQSWNRLSSYRVRLRAVVDAIDLGFKDRRVLDLWSFSVVGWMGSHWDLTHTTTTTSKHLTTNTNSNTNTATTSSSAASNTTTTVDADPTDLGRNSIPFSFLVAFLALFVAFMGIGLFARRFVYFLRLRLGLSVPEPRERKGGKKTKKERPVLWDVYVPSTREGGRWRDIKPLSCYFLHHQNQIHDNDDHQLPPDSPRNDTPTRIHTHHTTHTPLPHAFVGTGRMSIAPLPPPRAFFHPSLPPTRSTNTTNRTRTRTEITSPHPFQDIMIHVREFLNSPHPHPHPHHPHRHQHQHTHAGKEKTRANEDEEVKMKKPEGVRVAVLVAMPSEKRRWEGSIHSKAGHDRTSTASTSSDGLEEEEEEGGLERYGEMALGVADVAFEWEEEVVGKWEEEDGEEDEKV